jgi:hypothetical protein
VCCCSLSDLHDKIRAWVSSETLQDRGAKCLAMDGSAGTDQVHIRRLAHGWRRDSRAWYGMVVSSDTLSPGLPRVQVAVGANSGINDKCVSPHWYRSWNKTGREVGSCGGGPVRRFCYADSWMRQGIDRLGGMVAKQMRYGGSEYCSINIKISKKSKTGSEVARAIAGHRRLIVERGAVATRQRGKALGKRLMLSD